MLMDCGCVSQGKDLKTGKPVCVVHFGLGGGLGENPAKTQPDSEGRRARCSYGGAEVQSRLTLPFFMYYPDESYDKYYCGCRGWD